MNNFICRLKELYMEPIKRKVVFLGLMLFLTLAIFIFFQEALQHLIGQQEQALANQSSRRELGSALISYIMQLELNAQNLYHIKDIRDLEVIHKQISEGIKNTKTTLKVLQQGGIFKETLQTNFQHINQIQYEISYRAPASRHYVLEAIDITPKIIDLEHILAELKATVALRVTRTGETHKTQTVNADTLFKQAQTLLLRSQENANKIFYDTQTEIQFLKEEIDRTRNQFVTWRFIVAALLLLLSLMTCRRTLRQISRILKERQTYSLNLQRAHESFQHIVQAMPAGMVVVDEQHRIKRVNEYALKVLKAEGEDELIGKKCRELFCNADIVNCPLVTGSSEAVESEIVLKALDGSNSIILKKAIASSLENEPVILEAFIDITQWKRAERVAGERQSFINAIFQSVAIGIVVVDANSKKIIDANPQALRTLEADSTDIIGRSCLEMLCPRNDMPCPIMEQGKKALEMECQLRTLNGRKTPIIKRASTAILNNRLCVIESFIDIQRLKEAEEEVYQLNQELEERVAQRTAELARTNMDLESALKDLKETQSQLLQSEKMASIGQLAAGVAHEINNPVGFVHSNLNTIEDYRQDITKVLNVYDELESILKSGDAVTLEAATSTLSAIETVKNEIDLNFIQEDYRNVITESLEGLNRVIKIVADLKNFAHAESDEMKWADLNEGINGTLNIVWNEIKYKAEVVKDLGDLPQIKCFPQRINQVLMNLMVNAAQSIEEKGTIHIKTEAARSFVTITVKDTGSGISPENLNKIFDPFFTTKEIGKGTGLGLHVVYNIINSHNGSIEVASEVGKGTTFTLHLPVDPDQLIREEAVPLGLEKITSPKASGEQFRQPA